MIKKGGKKEERWKVPVKGLIYFLFAYFDHEQKLYLLTYCRNSLIAVSDVTNPSIHTERKNIRAHPDQNIIRNSVLVR